VIEMTQDTNHRTANIDQSRAIGQDSPTEGSRQGREKDKASGYPGTPDIGTNAGQTETTKDKPQPSDGSGE
jgi:hypothetical protein